MAIYFFRASDTDGRIVEGDLEAGSLEGAGQELIKQGLLPLELKEKSHQKSLLTLFTLRTTNARELSIFAYQTGALLGAGLPLLAGLELGRKQFPLVFRSAIISLQQTLKEGSSLAAAMEKEPEVFPPLMISMVEAGEIGGILEESFAWLAEHYEREAQILEKLKSALAYPLLVLVLSILSLIFLLTFVLPNFAFMLDNMGIPLPYLTRMVLGISSVFINWGMYLCLLALASTYGVYRILQTPRGKRWRDQLILQAPLIGDLTIKVMAARFCRILGGLLGNGVPILQSLEVVKKTLENQILMESLVLAEVSLLEGKGLAKPLAKGEVFPHLLLQMVAIGEETGRLPKFLLKLSDYYDKEIERFLERLTTLLEPTLVLLLGGLVGGIVLAILLPLFSLLGAV